MMRFKPITDQDIKEDQADAKIVACKREIQHCMNIASSAITLLETSKDQLSEWLVAKQQQNPGRPTSEMVYAKQAIIEFKKAISEYASISTALALDMHYLVEKKSFPTPLYRLFLPTAPSAISELHEGSVPVVASDRKLLPISKPTRF